MVGVTVSALSSLSYTDRVITRSLQSCVNKASTVKPSTRPYFTRYASYALELLESRLDATEKSWFPVLSKYDGDFGERAKAHYPQLREATRRARETLLPQQQGDSKTTAAVAGGEEDRVPKVLAALWGELEPVLRGEQALLGKVGASVSAEDRSALEEEDKRRRLALMKKDGHLWCAAYTMRSLTPKERESFPPGVPGLAKSAMLTAGNWQFSRLVAPFRTSYMR